MTEDRVGTSTRTSSVIQAMPWELYEAFVDPDILTDWLPSAEMSGQIHAVDARVGGACRMSQFCPADERMHRDKTTDNEVGARLSLAQLARRFG